MNNTADSRRHAPDVPVLIGFSLLIIAILGLASYHFAGRSYRQDEAWLVHWAIVHAQQPGGLLMVFWHNLTGIASEYWLMDVWVALFGQAEPVTRFLATLLSALALAGLFRLSKDLFNAKTGLLAVFVLGSLAFFQFFAHETRAYPALIAGATGLLLLFERWLVYRRSRYLVAYVLLAIMTFYLHAYVLYVIAAQGLFFVLFVRWQRPLWLRTIGAFVVTGILLLPRFLSEFNYFRGADGGIDWYNLKTNFESLQILQSQLQIAPEPIGQFILLLGLLLPVVSASRRAVQTFRFGSQWHRVYLVAVPLTILVLAFGVNLVVSNVTPRNLIVILPPLAILVAYALATLRWQARVVLLLLIAIPAITTFTAYIANGPYAELVQFVEPDLQPDDRFVIEGTQLWEHVPIAYYLQERLSERIPNASLFQLMYTDGIGLSIMPDPPIHWADNDSAASLAAFRAFLDRAERVWYVRTDPVSFAAAYQTILDASYVPVRSETWGLENGYPPHTFIEYRRIPDRLENPYQFGDKIQLRHWELRGDVAIAACATVRIESWWSANQTPSTNYSLTLTLVDHEGQRIVQHDGTPAGILMQLWQPGQLYLDERSLTVPCTTPPGDYDLIFSLYDYQTLASLPISGEAHGAAYLTTLHVR